MGDAASLGVACGGPQIGQCSAGLHACDAASWAAARAPADEDARPLRLLVPPLLLVPNQKFLLAASVAGGGACELLLVPLLLVICCSRPRVAASRSAALTAATARASDIRERDVCEFR